MATTVGQAPRDGGGRVLMENPSLREELSAGLVSVPLLDVHTHLDSDHLAARGLHDILLYHMLVSDLASAGCSSRDRLSEEPSRAEGETRLREAIPFLHQIRNTSATWGARIILRDLYDWREPVTLENWQRLDDQIRERASESAWAESVLTRAGIQRASTEWWRRRHGNHDDLLQYCLEAGFFARTQPGVNDIALVELEWGCDQPLPMAPLPAIGPRAPRAVERRMRTVDDVRHGVARYVARIPRGKVISTAQHISTDICYRKVSEDEMTVALARRSEASSVDQGVYANYILSAFLDELEPLGAEIVFQFSLGAEPLPWETGSKLRQETIFELADLIASHPRIRFQVFLASEHGNQSICTLVRELPNLSLAGVWWHNYYPGIMRKIISDRLDMVAANKQVGFLSDSYCAEWSYAKAMLVRAAWADVLASKVTQGQYSQDEALGIARQILFESPQSLLGMVPRTPPREGFPRS